MGWLFVSFSRKPRWPATSRSAGRCRGTLSISARSSGILTNGKSTPEGKGLIGMLRYYGFDAIEHKHKDAMRDRIMHGWPFTPKNKTQFCNTAPAM